MKLEDLTDWIKLRRQTRNPYEIVRFRKRGRTGDELRVDYLDRPPLYLRGGTEDHHVFHRINLRDEYRLGASRGWRCVVDLGGNVGLFAVRAAQIAERVITCEPVSVNFERLLKNCAGYPSIEPRKLAVNGTGEPVRIWFPREQRLSGQFSLYEQRLRQRGVAGDDAAYEDVEAKTLDRLFADEGIESCDLLKVDVEGAEYEILGSASDATFDKIARIHGEYHKVGGNDPATRIDVFREFLGSKGYEVETVPHRRLENHGLFFARRAG